MQYYTKQQLQGAGKYAAPALMGNWNEDGLQDEEALKDYLYKKNTGGLQLDVMRFRMGRSLEPTTLTTVANDGMMHFGDLFQLASCVHGSVLSVDTEDVDPRPTEYSCAVSSSANLAPMRRNTFLLVKYQPPTHPKYGSNSSVHGPVYKDEFVHYGQKFNLLAHAEAFGHPLDDKGGPDPWYVRSVARGNNYFAKRSRHQEVSCTPRVSYDCVWSIVDPDPSKRPKMEGQPIPLGVPVLLEHCSTRQHLNCEDITYWNDFGEEHEVTAHSTQRFNSCQVMERVTNGCPLTLCMKNQEASNSWVFKAGTTVARLPAAQGSSKDKKKVIKKLLQQLSKMGVNGFRSMEKAFNEFDTDGSKALDSGEFTRALAFVNICLTPSETQVVMDCFDTDNNGKVDLTEFCAQLKFMDNQL